MDDFPMETRKFSTCDMRCSSSPSPFTSWSECCTCESPVSWFGYVGATIGCLGETVFLKGDDGIWPTFTVNVVSFDTKTFKVSCVVTMHQCDSNQLWSTRWYIQLHFATSLLLASTYWKLWKIECFFCPLWSRFRFWWIMMDSVDRWSMTYMLQWLSRNLLLNGTSIFLQCCCANLQLFLSDFWNKLL